MKKYQEFIESALGMGKNPLIKKPNFMGSISDDLKGHEAAEKTLNKAPTYNKPTGSRGPRRYGTTPQGIGKPFELPSRNNPLKV